MKSKKAAPKKPRQPDTPPPGAVTVRRDADTAAPPAGEFDSWVPKAEALKLLGISERTLERWVGEGKLETRAQARLGSGRKPLVLVNPADIQRIREAASKPFVIPESGGMPDVSPKVEVLAKLIEALRPPTAPPEPPLFMTIDQVTQLHPALSRGFLLRLIHDGTLPAFRSGRGYVIHRQDLAELRPPRVIPSIPAGDGGRRHPIGAKPKPRK